jgi:hypothetical protein
MSGFLAVNVGSADRALRIIAGLVLLSLAFFGPKTPWGYLGIIPLLTGLSRRCPAYSIFGLSTCSKENA